MGATIAFASVVRKPKSSCSPSTGAPFVPRIPRHDVHSPAKANRGLSSATANQVGILRGCPEVAAPVAGRVSADRRQRRERGSAATLYDSRFVILRNVWSQTGQLADRPTYSGGSFPSRVRRRARGDTVMPIFSDTGAHLYPRRPLAGRREHLRQFHSRCHGFKSRRPRRRIRDNRCAKALQGSVGGRLMQVKKRRAASRRKGSFASTLGPGRRAAITFHERGSSAASLSDCA